MMKNKCHYLKIKHPPYLLKPYKLTRFQWLVWLVGISLIFNIFALIPLSYAATTDAMIVYDDRTVGNSTPKYKQWNGSSWGSASSATVVTGDILYMELKFSPVADKALLLVQGSSGVLSAQTWTGGATNSWGSVTTIGTLGQGTLEDAGTSDADYYRSWDFEFEQTSGDAVVVYNDGTADPDYKVWSNSSGNWDGSGTNINVLTAGSPNWIELASHPGSDRLAMILVDSAVDIYGMRWDGSAWDDMNSGGDEAVWDASAAIATRKCMDVAFETTTGDIIFIWGDTTATDQYYREYSESGVTLGAATLLDISTANTTNWVRLAADPTASSDQILLGVQDGSLDLNTREWSGTGWDAAHSEHDSAVENIRSMNFDIIWETHSSNPGEAWLVYGDDAGTSSRHWTGSAWDSIVALTSDDDAAVVRLAANPYDGALLAAVYEDNSSNSDNLEESHITGGGSAWSAQGEIWTGPVYSNTATEFGGSGFRTAIAAEMYGSSTDAMIVYDDRTVGNSTPKYKQWNGSSWGSASSATVVTGDILYMELKFSPVADKALLLVQGSSGVLSAQTWTGGATNSWGSVTTIGTLGQGTLEDAGTSDADYYRSWDFEFEQTSGDAVVVYNDGTADPDYKVWSNSSGNWDGSGTNINVLTAGSPNWIELASHPGSDRLAMILVDSAVDIYGMRWDGSAWDDMNSGGDEAVWDASAAIATRKCMDVAFETTTGDIIFIWSDTTSTDQYYREYSQSGVTLGAATLLDVSVAGGIGHWLRLAADPTASSDQILFGMQDAGLDLNTREWSGTGWDSEHAEHDAGLEVLKCMNFDIIWETYSGNPNEAWLVYGDDAGTSSRHWTGSAWDGIVALTSDDDTSLVRLAALPDSGDLLAASYESNAAATDNLEESHITGGGSAWSAQGEIWTGPVESSTATEMAGPGFKVAIAGEIAEGATLGITAPADVTLTTGNPGDIKETTWSAGEKVVVTDGGSGWSLTVIMQTTLTAEGSYTIPDANIKIRKDGTVGGGGDAYTIWSGTYTNITETNATESLDTSRTVGVRSSGTGGDTSEVRPTIQVVIPVGQHPADYTGAMRFTVA